MSTAGNAYRATSAAAAQSVSALAAAELREEDLARGETLRWTALATVCAGIRVYMCMHVYACVWVGVCVCVCVCVYVCASVWCE